MKNIKNNVNNDIPKNDNSDFAKEIDSLKNTKQRKFLNYFIPIAFFGYIFYTIIFPKFINKDFFSKYSLLFLLGITVICIIVFCCLYFRRELISETSYEIFDFSIDKWDNMVLFSYLNQDKKLKKCKLYTDRLLYIMHIEEENAHVIVENFGRNGNITREHVTKFFCNKEQYEKLSTLFCWKSKVI